jgi:hypothetical protein
MATKKDSGDYARSFSSLHLHTCFCTGCFSSCNSNADVPRDFSE